MDSLSFLTRDRAQVLSDYAGATGRSATLAAQRASLQAGIADYQRRLATLTAAQRVAVFNPYLRLPARYPFRLAAAPPRKPRRRCRPAAAWELSRPDGPSDSPAVVGVSAPRARPADG